MTSKRKNIVFKCIMVLLTYLFAELLCFIVIRSGYIPAKEPTWNFVWKNPQYPLPMADINKIWGAWHYPEPFQSQNGCIYFDYRINSYGARDQERQRQSPEKDRVIVLGDSFLEGYGVNVEDRLSNILERKTKRQFLNFCCADFGTTQEYLVYKNLAVNFDHSTILIGFLPFNDFENDDKKYSADQDRYRPFFEKTDSGYRLEYDKDSLQKSHLNKTYFKASSNSLKERAARFFRGFSYWFNIVDYVKNKKSQNSFFSFKADQIVSYYYDYRPEQLEKLRFVLTRLREIAPGKKIIFCSVPVIPDLIRRTTDGLPGLPGELKKICDPLSITYIDLLPDFYKLKKYRNYFFFCDSHWNEKAHRYAAEILSSYFQEPVH